MDEPTTNALADELDAFKCRVCRKAAGDLLERASAALRSAPTIAADDAKMIEDLQGYARMNEQRADQLDLRGDERDSYASFAAFIEKVARRVQALSTDKRESEARIAAALESLESLYEKARQDECGITGEEYHALYRALTKREANDGN